MLKGPSVAAAGGALQLYGTGLLQGQTFDAVTLTDATLITGLGSVTLTAMKPGDSKLKVVVVAGVATLAVTYSAGVLTITLASGGSSDDAIATAINLDASQCRGIIRAASHSLGHFLLAIASTPLVGGVGDYANTKVLVSGAETLPCNYTGSAGAAAWTDTGVKVIVPDLTALSPARATGDMVSVCVQSNGALSSVITTALTGDSGPSGGTGGTGGTGG